MRTHHAPVRPSRVARAAARVVAAVLIAGGLASPALAQNARAAGTVRDLNGKPIKGATVTVTNPDAFPPEFTSATDDKGRWAMIGLRGGTWKVVVEAPGFLKVETTVPIRAGGAPPMAFTLTRDLGPVPNALDRNIQQQLQDAAALRDAGRLDQALASYQDIRTRNPKLTAVNLVMADVYRMKASQETSPAARQALIAQATEAYTRVLESDASNERARAELLSLRAEASR